MATGKRRPYAQALADAEAFRAMFNPVCYQRWEFAGSLRRRKPEVADVEHVVIPAFGDLADGGLFSAPVRTNLLWHRLQELAEQGVVSRHLYGVNPTTAAAIWRWGEKYRGVDFNGFNNELFTADADNFGCQFLIRTGPAEFSERVVTKFKAGGMYRQMDGYLVHVASGARVSIADEETYFKLAGLAFVPPERRV